MVFFRCLLLLFSCLSAVIFCNETIRADENRWRYGGSLFGKLKYGKDFDHYDHANPDAPKGGRLNRAAVGSYSSFNPFITRGNSPAGLNKDGGLLYDTLFTQSIDQPAAYYGLIAEAFRFADDYSWVVYRLDPEAKWHDGEPITPEDVRWSMETLRKVSPSWSAYYANIKRVKVTGNREISFFFDQQNNRKLPYIVGDLPVLPKHWWTGFNAKGEKRDISRPITEPPLGSGPYRIGQFKMGKSITWDRVRNYWAENIPPQKGRFNFDQIHYTYFLGWATVWEAFKKGGIEDIRTEWSPRRWARSYDFPAVARGDILRREFPRSGPQLVPAYYLNTRKNKLKDRRVREALSLLLDFESMNRVMFFNSYKRIDSFFEGGELESQGLPEGRELEILEQYRGRIPDDVFGREFTVPDYSEPDSFRSGRQRALKLFMDAGYHSKNGKMLNREGKPFTLEFLVDSPAFARQLNPYLKNLKKLGIDTTLRVVDEARYMNRLDDFDYDVVDAVAIQPLSPGNEQREFWTSRAAKTRGSSNYSGISNTVIDDLTERIISATSRHELVNLVRALDRILKWNFYAIPKWQPRTERRAWRRKLKFIDKQPSMVRYGDGVYDAIDIYSFWIDP